MKTYTATYTNIYGEKETVVSQATDIHSFMCWVCQQGAKKITKYEQIN